MQKKYRKVGMYEFITLFNEFNNGESPSEVRVKNA